MRDIAVVSGKGARRWAAGHPWIFRSDVAGRPDAEAGAVRVVDTRRRPLGVALWSPKSEISLRMLDQEIDRAIDAGWWEARLAGAIARRRPLEEVTNACRLAHAEADGCPSLICDRYDDWLVVQLLSAGIEAFRTEIVEALQRLTGCSGVLARNDVPVRAREGLTLETTLLAGDVPPEIEVQEYGIRYLAAPWEGQKTGAFLDQRDNRALVGAATPEGAAALDCFGYHGSFALHIARRAGRVTVLDSSASALVRARENFARNGLGNGAFLEANAFDHLRAEEQAGTRYDLIVLDPPAFAKSRASLPGALRGYKEINLRAMRLLEPGGRLYTASCSYHLTKPIFLEMLEEAAADSGRRIALRELRGQPIDHPEVLTIPETGYIKGALLEALD